MKKLSDLFHDVRGRFGNVYGTRLLLPLFLITAFCFGYTEFKIHSTKSSDQPWQASVSGQNAPSATSNIEDIPLADQQSLPQISVDSNSNATLDTPQTTQSQVPDTKAVSNPQAALHSGKELQNTISQELYLSLLQGQKSE